MSEIIDQRLKKYNINTIDDEINALKEISQELILYCLEDAGIFKEAFFCGGTALRMLYGLPRFSEDLDFSLKNINPDFNIDFFTDEVVKKMHEFGVDIDIGKKRNDSYIIARELKNDSLKRKISFPVTGKIKKIMIKVEIDINPPSGFNTEDKFLDFPYDYAVSAGDLPTLFAGKSHSLLCRKFVKGRDWYDFLWHASGNHGINFEYLSNALNQMGPYKGQRINITGKWYLSTIRKVIESSDIEKIKSDVIRFIKPEEQKSLKIWSRNFFLSKLAKIEKRILKN